MPRAPRPMLAFLIRFLSLFALALWIGGGAAVAFLVAPAVFEHAGSRKRAGDIVGTILQRFDVYVLIAGPIAAAGIALDVFGVLGGGPDTPSLKLWLVLGMLALAVYGRLAITPKIRRLRDEMGDQLDRLPLEDPRRRAFGRLHGFSVVCLLLQLLLGAFVLALSVTAGIPKVSL